MSNVKKIIKICKTPYLSIIKTIILNLSKKIDGKILVYKKSQINIDKSAKIRIAKNGTFFVGRVKQQSFPLQTIVVLRKNSLLTIKHSLLIRSGAKILLKKNAK